MTGDKTFVALSSPIRRRILAYLSKTTLSSSEISERFDMTKPSISKHLGILENAGLVTFEKKGQFVYYSLAVICPESRVYRKESAAIARSKKEVK